jgi:hypothetical protein
VVDVVLAVFTVVISVVSIVVSVGVVVGVGGCIVPSTRWDVWRRRAMRTDGREERSLANPLSKDARLLGCHQVGRCRPGNGGMVMGWRRRIGAIVMATVKGRLGWPCRRGSTSTAAVVAVQAVMAVRASGRVGKGCLSERVVRVSR